MSQMFRWAWTPPLDWVDQLAALAPRQEHSSHLHLLWGAGTPVDPVQRWIIYQAVPARYLTPGRLEMFLHYAPCRCLTRPIDPAAWDAPCPRCQRRPDAEHQRVLEYYLQTGCLSAPFWVIQGTAGGHKWKYSALDAQWARFAEQPDEAPVPGSLCYAPFDQRVVRKLRAYDLAQRAQRDFAGADAVAQRDAAEAMRKAQLRAYQTDAEDLAHDLWGAFSDVPTVHDARHTAIDEDAVDEAYVTTGDVNVLL